MDRKSKALQQRDKNAARRLLTGKTLIGKTPNSCDQSLPAPFVVVREENGNTAPAKTATTYSSMKLTRQPVMHKKRENADPNKTKKPRKKQGYGKKAKETLTHADQMPSEAILAPRSTRETQQELEAARMYVKKTRSDEEKEIDEMPSKAILAPTSTRETQQELEAARMYVEKNRSDEEKEIDETDDMNVMMVTQYGGEIFEHLQSMEKRLKPKALSISAQPQSYWKKRAQLMNWLVVVHDGLKLLPEILFLAVNVFDRYLGDHQVTDGELQLFGVTSLFIATKYEDDCRDYTILREDLLDIAGYAFSDDELFETEARMLEGLDYDLGWPGPLNFVRRISRADDYDVTTRTLCKYFLDVAIMDKRFVDCIPSYLSAGAYRLAQLILNTSGWWEPHIYYSGYTEYQLQELVLVILKCCSNPKEHHAAVYNKYNQWSYESVSALVQDKVSAGFSYVPVSR